MLGYPQEDFSFITIGPLHVSPRGGATKGDAVREAIYLAFLENRRVVLEFNDRELEISPDEITEAVLGRVDTEQERLAGAGE